MQLAHHHRTEGRHAIPRANRPKGQQGYILVMFGLLLIPLLLMVGFSVDVGSWYNRVSQIQKAADSAALAGVVWLPDETKARTEALEAAKRNGFDDAASNIVVTAVKSTISPRRLVVTVTDNSVGSFIYEQITGKRIKLARTAFAEYVLPVPLGSPRNYFGLGRLLVDNPVAGAEAELLYQSVNPWCTDKYDGDRYQSKTFGNSGGGTVTNCPGTANNADYNGTKGYELFVEAPANRTSAIDIRLYDPSYNLQCNTPTYTYSNWTRADGSSGYDTYSPSRSFSGPGRRYWNGSRWVELNAGQSASSQFWQTAQTATESGCADATDNAVDSKWGGAASDEWYTFSLYSADNTPLDDNDNPLICTETFTKDTPFDGYNYLGSRRWNNLCGPITTAMPSGRYIVKVRNGGGVTSPIASGSNQWGMVARYQGASGAGLCDGRAEPPTARVCPRVFGKDAISVYANTESGVAAFYLAEIESSHAGKKLKIELWDPGEGGNNIQFLKPTGANSWGSPATFTWESRDNSGALVSQGGPTTQLGVTGSVFNGRLVIITIDLAGYAPPTGNDWWKIQYTFSSGAGNVHDRTTWGARIIGDPVHLTEEY
jgi:hypothetical protein